MVRTDFHHLTGHYRENSVYLPTPMTRRSVSTRSSDSIRVLVGADDGHLLIEASLVARIGFRPEVLGVSTPRGQTQYASMLEIEFRALSWLVERLPVARAQLGTVAHPGPPGGPGPPRGVPPARLTACPAGVAGGWHAPFAQVLLACEYCWFVPNARSRAVGLVPGRRTGAKTTDPGS